jgi:hypothetical protein
MRDFSSRERVFAALYDKYDNTTTIADNVVKTDYLMPIRAAIVGSFPSSV